MLLKAALVGMFALVAIGSTPLSAEPAAQIAQVKSMLRLTPAQERYWPPVEAALRNLVRHAASEDDGDGVVQRVKARASRIATNAAAVQRLVAAARPLIRILDDEQKQTARALAGSYGAASLASAL
jgi:LTXXQ motif family protein